jgi:hypothetical protein
LSDYLAFPGGSDDRIARPGLSSFLIFIWSVNFNLKENHAIIMLIRINEAVFAVLLVIEGAIVKKSYLSFLPFKMWKVFNIGCGVMSGATMIIDSVEMLPFFIRNTCHLWVQAMNFFILLIIWGQAKQKMIFRIEPEEGIKLQSV